MTDMTRTDHLSNCPFQGMRWITSSCNCAFLLSVSNLEKENNMNWKVLNESTRERQARRISLVLRIIFLVLLFAGIFGLLSGCETIHYMSCSLKGDC